MVSSTAADIAFVQVSMTLTTLTLPEWINSARSSTSKEDYISCAVSLASHLINYICPNVGSNTGDHFEANSISSYSSLKEAVGFDVGRSGPGEEKKSVDGGGIPSSFCLVQIEDILPENILVHVPNNISTQNESTCARTSFMASKVTIEPGHPTPIDLTENPQLIPQRKICAALGSILFELFSQGDRWLLSFGELLLDDIDSIFDDDAAQPAVPSLSELFSDDIDINFDDDAAQPVLKKAATLKCAPRSQRKSTKVKEFLQKKGLPISICRLVGDLLEAEEGNSDISSTAVVSLEEARSDLMKMRAQPMRFLYDITCPTTAVENTSLFNQMDGQLYGREKELITAMDRAARVAHHIAETSETNTIGGHRSTAVPVNGFLCEAVFLTGHSGCGKSSIIRRLSASCSEDKWLVLTCKFERRFNPLSSLLQSFDNFFGRIVQSLRDDGSTLQRDPMTQKAFARISQSIMSSIDSDSFGQLCSLLPNLGRLFPMAVEYVQEREMQCGRVGSGRNRLKNLFQIIFRAVNSGGRPVTFILEDIQWSDALSMDIVVDSIQTSAYSSSITGGILLLASFRDDDVAEDGFLMKQIKCMERSPENINVNKIFVGELPMKEINKLLSDKFCLSYRYTRELAQLVYRKTRGNPLYIIEFLRSIISDGMIYFSVKSRTWTWDYVSIDMQMISDSVVDLLTKKLKQLPHDVIEALKVASCFGQVSESTIELLDLGQFVPSMSESLNLATEEGIVEKAGPVFAFSHDMLQESAYNLIPLDSRNILHLKIGMSLVQDPTIADNAELCALAVDQINMCKNMDDIMDPSQRSLSARLSLSAGRHSMKASSYEQARGYFDAGISLLHADNWVKQYSLSLELYKMSAIVSFMDGEVEAVSSRLEIILSNAKAYEDTLDSRALRAKLQASQERYVEAKNELLDLLSSLGEEFPQNISQSNVASEMETVRLLLKDTTEEKILNLPKMDDTKKLNAMKFMGLLTNIGIFTSPMLVALVSCRMIRLTFGFGFCEDTISCLAAVSHALIHYSGYTQLASRAFTIAESLNIGNQHEHSLRVTLTVFCSAKVIFEPLQAVAERCLNGHNSAKVVGDIDGTAWCGLLYCIVHIYAISDLLAIQRYMRGFLHQLAKHKRIGILHSVMSYFDSVAALVGNGDSFKMDSSIVMKTNDELYQTAEQTQSTYLMHYVILNQIFVHFYFREYISVLDLTNKYATPGVKRVLDMYLCFFKGLSALCLARDTNNAKWRSIGESCVQTMTVLEENNSWTFENNLLLLQAELHYLDGRFAMAELSYQASIASAYEHRFYHEEALACELYGVYLVENKDVANGLENLQISMEKYRQWGAIKKASAVGDFIELINQPAQSWRHWNNNINNNV